MSNIFEDTNEDFNKFVREKSSNKYVLIYTDKGCTCDGLARIYGVFDTLSEAQSEMTKDVNYYLTNNPDVECVEDAPLHRICEDCDEECGCTWQILVI